VILEFIKFNRYINLRHSLVVLSIFSDKHYLLYYDVGQERVKRKRKRRHINQHNRLVEYMPEQNETKNNMKGQRKKQSLHSSHLL